MRLIFIAGFGEDEFIFDKIRPHLPGEHLCLSLWKELPDIPVRELTVVSFARQLVDRNSITAGDIILGHSTGGWVALHIKQLVGASVIQLSSWTDRSHLVTPVSGRQLIFFAVKSGLYFNRFTLQLAVRRSYRGKPSQEVFKQVFRRLMEGNKANVVNQLRLIFNPFPERITALPDLRIHARADPVVRFPKQGAYEVPGDHFSLYTYPDHVVRPIIQFLNGKK